MFLNDQHKGQFAKNNWAKMAEIQSSKKIRKSTLEPY